MSQIKNCTIPSDNANTASQRVTVHKKTFPLVSIIVLTYNQQFLLKDCLTSILNQNYPNLELIVCDDASADFDIEETTKLIEKLKKNNLKNYIVYKQPENVGTTKNAAKGIELSSGEIFKLHAGDDMLFSPKVISSVVRKFLHDENIRLLAGRSVACMHDGRLTDYYYPSVQAIEKMRKANCEAQFKLMSTQAWGEYINAPAVFWTRELYDEIGGFDLQYRYTEDWPTWLKITAKGIKIISVMDVFTIYRYGGISNSVSNINRILGEVHYKECIHMLQTMSVPVLKEKKDWNNLKKCMHCIQALESRIVCEMKWDNMSTIEHFSWKLSNMRFLLQSRFYRKGALGFSIPIDKLLIMSFLLLCLAFYFIQYFPTAVFLSKIACLFVLGYFGVYRKTPSIRRNTLLLTCFLYYIVQCGIIPVTNIPHFWANVFIIGGTVALAGSIIVKVIYWYMLRREGRELH